MTPHEKQSLIFALQTLMKFAENMKTETSCLHCKHYQQTVCNKWEEVVPEENIVEGCESWEFDGCPIV
jgi:hypothetical protein